MDFELRFDIGGSGTGISYYNSVSKCPRRALLDKEHGQGGASKAMMAGTTFHKLGEVYHMGYDPSMVYVKDPTPLEAESFEEGQRMFEGYKHIIKPDHWGNPIAAEAHFPGECEPDCEAKDMDNKTTCRCARFERERKILKLFNDVPVTGRLDLFTYVDEEHLVKIQKRMLGEGKIVPGHYIVDYKTSARKPSNPVTKHNMALQFPTYMLAWKELYPAYDIKGALVINVVGHKKMTSDSISCVMVPFPDEQIEKVIGTFLSNMAVLAKTNMPVATACYDGFRACSHVAVCGRA